jgi:hypothetical protein
MESEMGGSPADVHRVTHDVLQNSRVSLNQTSDGTLVYTTVDNASPLTLVIDEANSARVDFVDCRSIIRHEFDNVIGTSTEPEVIAQFQLLRDWVVQHVRGVHSIVLADIILEALLEASHAGFVETTAVLLISQLVQSLHTTSESHATRKAVSDQKQETKQNRLLRMVCEGRAVGDMMMQPSWVDDFMSRANADAMSQQRAFLKLYIEFQEFPLSKKNASKARESINSLLRQRTDMISRRDLTKVEKKQIKVKIGCMITVGTVAHRDSDAEGDLLNQAKARVENGQYPTVGYVEHGADDAANSLTDAPEQKKTENKRSRKQQDSVAHKRPRKVKQKAQKSLGGFLGPAINVTRVLVLGRAAPESTTDHARFPKDCLFEVLQPVGDKFQWFLGKIAASRQQDDGVHLTVLWETGPIPKDGEETKFKFSRPSSRCTYIAYELSVENAFVFEERKGDKGTKFAAGLWPAAHEPMYSSGQYFLMRGGSEIRDSSLPLQDLQAQDFGFKMQVWRNAACAVPYSDDRVNTSIEDVLDLDDMSEGGIAAWDQRISAVKMYDESDDPEMARAVNASLQMCAPHMQKTAAIAAADAIELAKDRAAEYAVHRRGLNVKDVSHDGLCFFYSVCLQQCIPAAVVLWQTVKEMWDDLNQTVKQTYVDMAVAHNEDGGYDRATTDPELRAIRYALDLTTLDREMGTYANQAAVAACAQACEVYVVVHTTQGVSTHGNSAHERVQVLLHKGHYRHLTAITDTTADFAMCELFETPEGKLVINACTEEDAVQARTSLADLRVKIAIAEGTAVARIAEEANLARSASAAAAAAAGAAAAEAEAAAAAAATAAASAAGTPGSPEPAASPAASSPSSSSAEFASNSSESAIDSSSSGASAATGGGTSATGITSAEYISLVVRGGCQLLVFGCTCKTTTWKSWDVCTCGTKVRKTGGWPPQRHCTRPDFVFDR